MRALNKKMQQLENDLDQAQEQLLAANAKLEEKDKALQNVSVKLAQKRVGETKKKHTEMKRDTENRHGRLASCISHAML